MMQVAAPAVVAPEDGTDDDSGIIRRDQAQARIALQVGANGFPRVGFVETETFARAPEREDGVIVGEGEVAQTRGGRKGMRE
jgi:hypothetical protein